mmetsp:Transcript_45187/g.118616  ORF Transcript_45187/g.118616 Transcript_45187/m.118616 type:complete len:83 (+) Transcript_45187:1272-1520(+)
MWHRLLVDASEAMATPCGLSRVCNLDPWRPDMIMWGRRSGGPMCRRGHACDCCVSSSPPWRAVSQVPCNLAPMSMIVRVLEA